ncbi:sigma-54 interaction domain-containing protein [Thiohalomonas denitrificans]|uniref:Regulatory protein, Fis family n=1 Tax=Thiohalomonas denitrificans TaxID=415747 RepID=A0A1G5QQT7_9GAMM|nr:sigma-54 dependent transcriptional regulator [Thiohalomonas denitrificans]SCZ63651.1 regulatory protein, Fis family [Thiohalomonas denitrificans]
MSSFEKELLGDAPEFQAVIRSAEVIAATDVTVLILGESGTGKELLARAVHARSRRAEAPFVTINCAALPEGLAESELFGHCKGAFTGAVNENVGRVRAAEGGTLFLDEIGELPLAIQAKLLRFLESGECQAVGSTHCRQINTRIVAATHRDLHSLVQEGRFREDLYYRLNVIPLEVPPLRHRTGDTLRLVPMFTRQLADQHGLEAPRLLPEALDAMETYDWPGNVRELRNVCERLVILFGGREVTVDNLPAEIRHKTTAATRINGFELPDGGIRFDQLEQSLLLQALEKSRGNRSRAARLVGLTRDTFLYRLKKYAIG